MPMVTIRMVTPQAIEVSSPETEMSRAPPKTPQVQIEKEKLIPEPEKKKKKVKR